MGPRASSLVAAVAAAAATAACGLVAGLKLPDLVDAPDAASAVTEAGPPAPCDPRLPPLPADPGGGGGAERVTFATQYIAFGSVQPDGGGVFSVVPPDPSRLCAEPGIDLDGQDTSCESPEVSRGSCKRRGKVACDTKGGGDNAAAPLVALSRGISPDPADDPNPPILEGAGGVLLDLAGYNGRDDDPSVEVRLVFAAGLQHPDGGLGAKPRFDSADVWVGDILSFSAGQNPRYSARDAYVAGGILVARFVDTPFQLGSAGVRLDASELVVTAKVVRDASGAAVRLDYGRIGMRIALSKLLEYAGGRVEKGIPLCDPDGGFASPRTLLLSTACTTADLLASAGASDPERPCDAVSYAAGFYAVRAVRADRGRPSLFDAGTPRECPFAPWPIRCEEAGF